MKLIRFGFTIIHRYLDHWPMNLVLEPIFLGGVMGQAQNKPPGTNPFKAKYMHSDLKRCSEQFQIPMKPPSVFPANTLFAQRILTACKLEFPQHLSKSSFALWKAYWQDDQGLETDTLKKYLDPIVGQDFDKILELANTERIKNELTEKTKMVTEVEGAFGAPWIVVEKDGKKTAFFGSDRFEALAFWAKFPYLGPTPNKSNL